MKRKAGIPLLLATAMVMGFWLGLRFNGSMPGSHEPAGWQKIEQILQYVEQDYVDTVSRQTLEDEVIAYLLQRLDPHSYYISPDEVQAMNEPLEGGFEGIGIQFNLRNDTIYVINTVAGGPSERAGLQPGDRIIGVDGDTIAGRDLSNKKVMALLKGPTGSKVSVQVLRGGDAKALSYDITRGEIPLNSIDAAYHYNDSTIYVRLSRFSKTTLAEFRDRVYALKNKSSQYFILDLRGNGGGFLDAAVDLADEFLSAGKLVTYTEGKARPRLEYHATGEGAFENVKLYVLIDHYSASASEIFAGAIQDHKRGVIIGKRSFGKGLVQEQSEWADGSATRLTVARYYTPNGRSIQRPYSSFSPDIDYYSENADSAQQGGIVPDLEVKHDTAGVTWLYAEIVHRGLLNDFVYHFRDAHYSALKDISLSAFVRTVTNEQILQALHEYLRAHNLAINEAEWKRSAPYIATRSKALIARSLFDDEAYYIIFNPSDASVQAALEVIKNRNPGASV